MADPGSTQRSPELSFLRQDPERRFGLPAGRFTQPNHFVAGVGGLVLTGAVYGAVALAPESIVSQSLTQRGPTPYAIVFFAMWALVLLWVKHRKIRFQDRARRLELVPRESSFVLSAIDADGIRDRLYDHVDEPDQFVLANRIHMALSNLRNMQNVSDVRAVLESQAETDEGVSESSYTVVRGLIWAIPVLGFIGTVLGLSAAIGDFGQVLSTSGDIEQLKPALQEVTGGLAVAFETTLQGLLAALFIHMLATFIHREEEQFLDDCREYTQKRIVERLRLIESDQ